ncbi:hypothetical protein LXM94_18615, partial [Rhizobium sp. TRM95111]|uniref:hypothetical protein n=1 Tax=Rhizobium alarense TaxID=2846851 RepID=UPI001F26AA6B
TTPCWTYQPWPHNLNQTVSGKPGAVHAAAHASTEERCVNPGRQGAFNSMPRRKRRVCGRIGLVPVAVPTQALGRIEESFSAAQLLSEKILAAGG